MNSAQQSPFAPTLQPAFPRLTRAMLALLVFAGLVGRVAGQTYYGPDNTRTGSGAGFGTPASFTWDTTTAIWNTDSTGAKVGSVYSTNWVNWTSGDATANNANLIPTTSALTLTLGAAISVGSITANTGTGGSWGIITNSNSLTINTGSVTNATLTLSGGNSTTPTRLSLAQTSGGTYTFNTINFAADSYSVLDFGGSSATLTSTSLNIGNNATVILSNFAAASDAWTSTSISAPLNATTGAITGVTWTGGSWSDGTTTSQGYWVNGAFSTTAAPIPEPSTYGAIMAAGCAGLIGWRRRRSRREASAKA